MCNIKLMFAWLLTIKQKGMLNQSSNLIDCKLCKSIVWLSDGVNISRDKHTNINQKKNLLFTE